MRNALIDEVSEHCQFIYKQTPFSTDCYRY